MKCPLSIYENGEQPALVGVAEGNPNVESLGVDTRPPVNRNALTAEFGPIPPGTLYAQEHFSRAKLKAILAVIVECENDPFKLVARKLAEAAFLRPGSTG